eukprot:5013260-Pyramimonas_sp.AAC.1
MAAKRLNQPKSLKMLSNPPSPNTTPNTTLTLPNTVAEPGILREPRVHTSPRRQYPSRRKYLLVYSVVACMTDTHLASPCLRVTRYASPCLSLASTVHLSSAEPNVRTLRQNAFRPSKSFKVLQSPSKSFK